VSTVRKGSVEAILKELDFSPVKMLVSICEHPSTPLLVKVDCLKILMPFRHARLEQSSIAVTMDQKPAIAGDVSMVLNQIMIMPAARAALEQAVIEGSRLASLRREKDFAVARIAPPVEDAEEVESE
jgi:hypothetical protein